MFIAGLTNERPFGAVVRDVSDEVQCLQDIQSRNRRFARNPLSQYFLDDLLAPLVPREFGAAAHLSSDWQSVIDELKGLIDRAIDRLWSSLDLVSRPSVFDWRNPEMGPTVMHDFPRWAHEATTALLAWSYNIFRRGGEARAGDSYLIDMAHSYAHQSRLFSDGQIYTSLAIVEATKALRLLGEVVEHAEADDGVAFWIEHLRKPDIQSCNVRRKLYGAEVNKKIADALPDYLAPRVVDVMGYRIHAEKLMLIGDALAAGMLSADAARKLADEATQAQEQLNRRRKTDLKNVDAATAANRILTEEKKKEIFEAARAWREQKPDGLQKELYAEFATRFRVSEDTIKRALGKKR